MVAVGSVVVVRSVATARSAGALVRVRVVGVIRVAGVVFETPSAVKGGLVPVFYLHFVEPSLLLLQLYFEFS